MAYGTFKTLEEVALKFGIERKVIEFIGEAEFLVDEYLFRYLKKNLSNSRSYVSENSICEALIYPLLEAVMDKHNLPLWSHVRFDVSIEEGLTGIPDYLIAPLSKTGISYTKYGIATSGEVWKFGKLLDKHFTMDPIAYSSAMDLQKVFNILNWLVIEAKKNLLV
ncbi:MAG: hypothetical protein H7A23_17115 [Leptospiraceae bacterium]|nr:hypothetical protein [Leptospiraceae bacterium]MCP5496268.1 hypothetical protein [Leptospiraceae bacterium]